MYIYVQSDLLLLLLLFNLCLFDESTEPLTALISLHVYDLKLECFNSLCRKGYFKPKKINHQASKRLFSLFCL